MIRIAVLPVGGAIPHSQLREYAAMLGCHTRIDLSSISSFYKEHQKSPFAHQPWETGCLRFKYMLGGAPPSPWEDFQSCRKILAVVGLCDCPSSPDLDLVADQFAAACKGYSSALAKRCFAFCPTDSQVCPSSLSLPYGHHSWIQSGEMFEVWILDPVKCRLLILDQLTKNYGFLIR